MDRLFAIGCALALVGASGGAFAAPVAPPAPASVSNMQLADSTTMTVNPASGTQVEVHQQPDSTSRVLSTVDSGATVTVMEWLANGVWAHVQTNDGITGYVPANALR
jgi:uncharacterized protein YgiM (DUF1202 family)